MKAEKPSTQKCQTAKGYVSFQSIHGVYGNISPTYLPYILTFKNQPFSCKDVNVRSQEGIHSLPNRPQRVNTPVPELGPPTAKLPRCPVHLAALAANGGSGGFSYQCPVSVSCGSGYCYGQIQWLLFKVSCIITIIPYI